METRSLAVRPDVAVATSAPRVTPTPARGRFAEVLSQKLVRSAELAMRALPGSPLMALAVRGAPGGGALPGGAALGVPLAASSGTRAPEGPAALAAGPGISGAAPNEATSLEASLAQSQEMNLYYLQVQEAVNAQNRSFTAVSNVLKAQHDTVKTAIGNIR